MCSERSAPARWCVYAERSSKHQQRTTRRNRVRWSPQIEEGTNRWCCCCRCRCWCCLLLFLKRMLPLAAARGAAACCAAACCGGIAVAALRSTRLPPPLLDCRRYSYAVFQLFFRDTCTCSFFIRPCCGTSPPPPLHFGGFACRILFTSNANTPNSYREGNSLSEVRFSQTL